MTPYEIGKVYIWQNQVGEMAHLNGTECTVTDGVSMHWCLISRRWIAGQCTDSPCERGRTYVAEAGDLRPKDPPTGERSILDLFKLPELEPA